MQKETLMQRLLKAGYPREEMYHHESDLYIFVGPQTQRIVTDWYKDNRLSKNVLCSTFRDQITGRLMYDCAFQYDDYWKTAAARMRGGGAA